LAGLDEHSQRLGIPGGAWAAPLVIRSTDAWRSTVTGTLLAVLGIFLTGLSPTNAS
jgi:hypothetical protein